MHRPLIFFFPLVLIAFATTAIAQDSIEAADADAVLQDYVEAIGGQDAIERIENRVTKGKLQLGELEADITLFQRAPDHFRMIQVFPFGEMDQGYDGEQGWRTIPNQGRVPVVGEELEDHRFQFSLRQPLLIGEMYDVTRQPESMTLNERPMHVLEFTSRTGGAQQWYFDADTHLLERVDSEVDSPSGKVTVHTSYSEWKSVDGVLVPHRMNTWFGDMNVRLSFTSVEQNQGLNDEDFAPGD